MRIVKSDLNLIFYVFLVSLASAAFYYFSLPKDLDLIAKTDYLSFLTGASVIREGKGNMIYDATTQFSFQRQIIEPYQKEGLLPFRSLPFTALPFLPFSYFPLTISYRIFAAFNLAILGGLTILLGDIFGNLKKYKIWFLIPFLFLPVQHAVLQGQISLILSFIFLFLYLFIKSKKPFLAGITFGFLLFKPQFLLAFPLLLLAVEDKRRFICGAFLTCLFLLLVSIYLSGWRALINYPAFIFSTEKAAFGSRVQEMFTVSSGLASIPAISSRGYNWVLVGNGILYLAGLYLFSKKHKKVGFELSFVVLVVFILLFAVHVQIHDFSILLIPIFILLTKANFVSALGLFLLPSVVLKASPQFGTIIALAIAVYLLSLTLKNKSLMKFL